MPLRGRRIREREGWGGGKEGEEDENKESKIQDEIVRAYKQPRSLIRETESTWRMQCPGRSVS